MQVSLAFLCFVICILPLISAKSKLGGNGATFSLFQDATAENLLQFGTIDLESGQFSLITNVDQRFEILDSEINMLTFTAEGIFHIAVSDSDTGLPWLMTVDPQTGNAKYIAINGSCYLWQMIYDTQRDIMYGMILHSPGTNITLFTIDVTTGDTQYIGEFPYYLPANMRKTSKTLGGCWVDEDGGILFDIANQLIYLHYFVGAQGMFYEAISVLNAQVVTHGFFPTALLSPVSDPKFQKIYSITSNNVPPYNMYFAVLDIPTGKVQRFSQLSYDNYFTNEASLDYNQGLYTSLLTVNASSGDNRLVSIDITTGQVVYQPIFGDQQFIWSLQFSPYY